MLAHSTVMLHHLCEDLLQLGSDMQQVGSCNSGLLRSSLLSKPWPRCSRVKVAATLSVRTETLGKTGRNREHLNLHYELKMEDSPQLNV